MTWTTVNDENILREIGSGKSWGYIRDMAETNSGAFELRVKDMVRRKLLTDDGEMVRPNNED